MKRFSYIIVIMVALAGLLQGSSLIAQQPYRSYFGEEFTKWYVYSEIVDWSRTYAIILKNDTVVSIKEKEYKRAWVGTSEDIYITPDYCYLREERESGRLYCVDTSGHVNEGKEFLIADLSLQKGDTFRLVNDDLNGSWLYEDGLYRDDVGYYTIVDSVYYKDNRKHIRTNLNNVFGGDDFPFTFIEGLGPNYPLLMYFIRPNWFHVLTCYHTEKEFWHSEAYWNTPPNSSGDCIEELGIEKVEQPAPFKIAQSSGSIEAMFETGVNGTVALYNMQAQQLWSKQTGRELSIQIPTAGLSAGIYLLWVFDNERNRSWTEKVVVK